MTLKAISSEDSIRTPLNCQARTLLTHPSTGQDPGWREVGAPAQMDARGTHETLSSEGLWEAARDCACAPGPGAGDWIILPSEPRVRMRGRDKVPAPGSHGCKELCFTSQGLAAVSEWLLGRGCSGRRGSGADGAAVFPASGRRIREAGEAATR